MWQTFEEFVGYWPLQGSDVDRTDQMNAATLCCIAGRITTGRILRIRSTPPHPIIRQLAVIAQTNGVVLSGNNAALDCGCR